MFYGFPEIEAIGKATTAAYRAAGDRNSYGVAVCRVGDNVAEAAVTIRGINQHPSFYRVESVAVLWTRAEHLTNQIRLAHLPPADGVPAEDRPEWVNR